MQHQFKSFLQIGAVGIFLCACSGEPKTNEHELLEKADSTIAAAVEKDLEVVSYALPSPLQLASIFKKSGLKYVGGITNSPKNVTKYNSDNFTRAINLGVYSSDLAYSLFNKQFDEGKNYLKACQEIGTNLGIKKAFENNDLAERFNRNIGKEDSLLEIISEIQMESDIILEERDQKHIIALAFAGAWFESVYIAGKVYASDKNKNVCISLIEQFTIADNLIKALQATKEKEPKCEKLCQDIYDILALFQNSEAVKNSDHTEEIDFTKMTLSDKEFTALQTKITEVRNNLVK